MKFHVLALAVATAVAMGSAHADSFTFNGTIAASDATFNRPVQGGGGLSAVGTAVHYDVFTFSGITPGSYNFLSTSTGFDNFTLLYAGAFNPAAPLTNLIASNDDLGGTTTSGFAFTLSGSTSYTFVTTAFDNTGLGTYVDTITPVPEPESYVLMGLGLAGMGLFVRRRVSRG